MRTVSVTTYNGVIIMAVVTPSLFLDLKVMLALGAVEPERSSHQATN